MVMINPIDSRIKSLTNFRARPAEFRLTKGSVTKILEFPKNINDKAEKLAPGDPFYLLRYYSAIDNGRNFTAVETGTFHSAKCQDNGNIILNHGQVEDSHTVGANDEILTENQFKTFVQSFKTALSTLNKILQ